MTDQRPGVASERHRDRIFDVLNDRAGAGPRTSPQVVCGGQGRSGLVRVPLGEPEFGDGFGECRRTYAGMPSNWATTSPSGSAHVQVPGEPRRREVGYTLRTASLMTDPGYLFDDRDPPTTGCSGSVT
jgi:hypothetical protein